MTVLFATIPVMLLAVAIAIVPLLVTMHRDEVERRAAIRSITRRETTPREALVDAA